MSMWLKVKFLLAIVLLTSNLEAQTSHIMVKGSVVDALSGNHVEAKIKYESLPYGNYVGLFSGSTFEFSLTENNRYIFFITAEGFAPYQEIFTVTASSPRIIDKTIELQSRDINNFISMDKLMFSVGKSDLTKKSMQELDKLVYLFKQNENILIHLEGHSDFRGNAKQNMKLSEQRVEAVKKYLIEQGVNERSIKTTAFGGSQPLSKMNDPVIKGNNRRVEIKVFNYY